MQLVESKQNKLKVKDIQNLNFIFFYFFCLPYLSSIHEKAMYRYVLEGESALA